MNLLTPASGLQIGDKSGSWEVTGLMQGDTRVLIYWQNFKTPGEYKETVNSDAAYMISRS